MALVSWRGFDPFGDLFELQAALERMLQNPGLGLNLGPSGAGVFPPLNIFHDEGGVVVRAEVPGIPSSQISVTAEPRRLTISGERTAAGAEKGSYHRRERRSGQFSRAVQLPEGLDTEKASAHCRNGLLTVRIPRTPAAKPRQISVKTA